MEGEYVIKKKYKDNEKLRKSFNKLSIKIFGLNFEDWYENGYWGGKYIPYSIVYKDEVIANVSVNLMEFRNNGKNKKYIQIGTVMTEETYRNQGFIRSLIEEIEHDYRDKVDGFYLFANNSVLNFYPKFGFQKAGEYEYFKSVEIKEDMTALQVKMKCIKDWDILVHAIADSKSNSTFEMQNNMELYMFYITKFMQNNVFYIENENAYVIADIESENLFIHSVFAPKTVDIDCVIAAFGKNIKKVTLGFTPLYRNGYDIKEVQEEDTTLFLRGNDFDGFETEKKMFPTLSHA